MAGLVCLVAAILIMRHARRRIRRQREAREAALRGDQEARYARLRAKIDAAKPQTADEAWRLAKTATARRRARELQRAAVENHRTVAQPQAPISLDDVRRRVQ